MIETNKTGASKPVACFQKSSSEKLLDLNALICKVSMNKVSIQQSAVQIVDTSKEVIVFIPLHPTTYNQARDASNHLFILESILLPDYVFFKYFDVRDINYEKLKKSIGCFFI